MVNKILKKTKSKMLVCEDGIYRLFRFDSKLKAWIQSVRYSTFYSEKSALKAWKIRTRKR
jgi:hypothetical protein